MGNESGRDILGLKNVSYSFQENKVLALKDLSLSIRSGELTFLLGENGAGKSTLARLCCGFHRPKKGYITLGDKPYIPKSPKMALRKGIALVPQHPEVVPKLKVWQNLALAGHVPGVHGPFRLLRTKNLLHRYDQLLRTFGLQIDLEAEASQLSASEVHWLALAEALVRRPRFLFLDEPSAPYTPTETKRLYAILNNACRLGMGVVIITHRMAEISEYAQRVLILKNGSLALDLAKEAINLETISQAMFLKDPESSQPETQDYLLSPITKPLLLQHGEEVLNISALSILHESEDVLKGINLTLNAGQISGIFSPMDRSVEILEDILSGARAYPPGCITYKFAPYPKSAPGIRKLEIRYIPSRRFKRGIAYGLNIIDNLIGFRRKMSYKNGVWNQKGFMSFARYLPFSINRSMKHQINTLSGGMIQKVILNRELGENTPPLIFCFEPSWGLDSRLQTYLHTHLKLLAERGSAILIISSDIHEIEKLSDHAYSLKNGYLKEGLIG